MTAITTDSSIPGMTQGYWFDQTNHIHVLDGKPLYGVTNVLSIISKGGALTQWSANLASTHWLECVKACEILPTSMEIEQWYEDARFKHKKTKEEAGKVGTAAHKAIENFVKDGKIDETLPEKERMIFNNFAKWYEDNTVKVLESEKHIWSRGMWIGGIVDLVCEIEGKIYIADIKTASAIYPENWLQMAAYHLCLEEMGFDKKVEGYIVINLRKNGEMEIKKSYGIEKNKEGFKACLKLFKIIEDLKNEQTN